MWIQNMLCSERVTSVGSWPAEIWGSLHQTKALGSQRVLLEVLWGWGIWKPVSTLEYARVPFHPEDQGRARPLRQCICCSGTGLLVCTAVCCTARRGLRLLRREARRLPGGRGYAQFSLEVERLKVFRAGKASLTLTAEVRLGLGAGFKPQV